MRGKTWSKSLLPVPQDRHAVGDVQRQLDADALLGRFGDRPDCLRARRHGQALWCSEDTSLKECSQLWRVFLIQTHRHMPSQDHRRQKQLEVLSISLTVVPHWAVGAFFFFFFLRTGRSDVYQQPHAVKCEGGFTVVTFISYSNPLKHLITRPPAAEGARGGEQEGRLRRDEEVLDAPGELKASLFAHKKNCGAQSRTRSQGITSASPARAFMSV